MPTIQQITEALLSDPDKKCYECYVCVRGKIACPLHVTHVEEKVAKYFKGPLAEIEDEEVRDWKNHSLDALELHLIVRLGSLLSGFCNDYANVDYENDARKIVEHGKFDLSFPIEQLGFKLRTKIRNKVNARYLPAGTAYFPMGAIVCVSPGISADTFCCLFQDGTWFLRDFVRTCKSNNVKTSYKAKLMYLKRELLYSL